MYERMILATSFGAFLLVLGLAGWQMWIHRYDQQPARLRDSPGRWQPDAWDEQERRQLQHTRHERLRLLGGHVLTQLDERAGLQIRAAISDEIKYFYLSHRGREATDVWLPRPLAELLGPLIGETGLELQERPRLFGMRVHWHDGPFRLEHHRTTGERAC